MYQIVIIHVTTGKKFFSRDMPNEETEKYMSRARVEEDTFFYIKSNIPLKLEDSEGNVAIFPSLFLQNCIVQFVNIPSVEG